MGERRKATLLGSVFAGLRAEVVARESLGCGGGLEELLLESGFDQGIALRIVPRGAQRQAEIVVLVFGDQERAKRSIGKWGLLGLNSVRPPDGRQR